MACRSPAPRKGLTKSGSGCVAAVATGSYHTCALRTDGSVWCWGNNDYGQVWDPSVATRPSPTRVSLRARVIGITAGGSHTCAKKSNGTLWCWGENYYGEVGDGTTDSPKLIPFQVALLGENATDVSLGALHTCARKNDGTVWCWGYNYDGQLGLGVAGDSSVPVPSLVSALPEGIAQVEAGAAHACARTERGAVWCWGNNMLGQLGNGDTAESEPVPIESAALPSCVARIATGAYHTCALSEDGALHCWGSNDKGQLGAVPDGSPALGAKSVALADQVMSMDTGLQHTCAVSSVGALWCWGDNEFGQLGIGSNEAWSATPLELTTLGAQIVSVHTGYAHTCAVTTDKTLWCWGDNRFGQLGTGERDTVEPRPIPVTDLCDAR
ncbi:MAG TPA: hypothetical protein VI072_20915 [Polyangiaceae bacterium]